MAETVRLASENGALCATFVPSLGMIGCSLVQGADELLAQRGGLAAYAERGSSFGIPLLYPWANRLSGWEYEAGGKRVTLDRDSSLVHVDPDTGLPLHGLLTASPLWSVTATGRTRLEAELEFGGHPELIELFPFPHRLELLVAVEDERLALRLTVTPTGEDAVPISFGFHPYLQLPGCDRREWEIEVPVRRQVLLDDDGIPTGEHQEIPERALNGSLGERTFDDGYDRLDPVPVFSVSDQRRKISVELVEGYVVAQLYAPENSQFICFEPMTAPVNALSSGDGLRWVEPGSQFSAEFAIRVSSRPG